MHLYNFLHIYVIIMIKIQEDMNPRRGVRKYERKKREGSNAIKILIIFKTLYPECL